MEIMRVFMAKFHKDKPLQNSAAIPKWLCHIQAGAALTDERVADLPDSNGENISYKNPNYCELTVLYWIWKNCLILNTDINKLDTDKEHRDSALKPNTRTNCSNFVLDASYTNIKYYGLFHYRRWLDINDADIHHLAENDIDVILPYPTIHEPDIREHHARYIKETDWEAVLQALKELEPEYYQAYDQIFSQEYLYNYNILIAKAEVLKSYCEWLFPILERVEELSEPKANERADRYIGYIGENLLTLYFMYHKDRLNIVHTGRIMLT